MLFQPIDHCFRNDILLRRGCYSFDPTVGHGTKGRCRNARIDSDAEIPMATGADAGAVGADGVSSGTCFSAGLLIMGSSFFGWGFCGDLGLGFSWAEVALPCLTNAFSSAVSPSSNDRRLTPGHLLQ